jgi:hypothetical protein
MVIQAVRTRFPIRNASGMTILGTAGRINTNQENQSTNLKYNINVDLVRSRHGYG